MSVDWSRPVFLVGGGPSAAQLDLDKLRGAGTVVAINDSLRRLPWADVAFTADGSWISKRVDLLRSFEGERFAALPAWYRLPPEAGHIDRVYRSEQPMAKPDPQQVHGQNSGFAALDLVTARGAKQIALIGYDLTGPGHWHGGYEWTSRFGLRQYPKWVREFHNFAPFVKLRGAEVLNLNPESAIRCWPFAPFDQVVDGSAWGKLPPPDLKKIGLCRMLAMGVGLPKTGTTTLFRALRSAGLNAQHQHKNHVGFGPMMVASDSLGLDPFQDFPGIDAVTQLDFVNPQVNVWAQLDYGLLERVRERYPDLLFILQKRNIADTIASIDAWQNFRDLITRYRVPGLPAGVGADDRDLERWIEAHYAEIRSRFGAGRFVEFDIADPAAPDILSAALGIPLTWWGRQRPRPSSHHQRVSAPTRRRRQRRKAAAAAAK